MKDDRATLKIAELREHTGKTQQQVADEVGINIRQFQKYEYNEQEPRLSVAIKIACALNVRPEDLLKQK